MLGGGEQVKLEEQVSWGAGRGGIQSSGGEKPLPLLRQVDTRTFYPCFHCDVWGEVWRAQIFCKKDKRKRAHLFLTVALSGRQAGIVVLIWQMRRWAQAGKFIWPVLLSWWVMKPSPGLPIPAFLSPLSDKHLLRTYCAQPLGIQWCFQELQCLVKPIVLPCAAQFEEGLGVISRQAINAMKPWAQCLGVSRVPACGSQVEVGSLVRRLRWSSSRGGRKTWSVMFSEPQWAWGA